MNNMPQVLRALAAVIVAVAEAVSRTNHN